MRINNFAIIGGATIWSVPAVLKDMKDASSQHKSALWAGGKSVIRNNWQNILMVGMSMKNQFIMSAAFGALSAGPSLSIWAGEKIAYRNDYLRMSRTPFSQSFEHSEASARAQQRGLQAMSGYRSLAGAEASSMAARYGRR